MWSVVLSCFPYLVSFTASPFSWEALECHGMVDFVFCNLCFGLQFAKSLPGYAQRDFVTKV